MEDKKEHQILKKWKLEVTDKKPSKRTKIQSLYVFVSDTRRLHDSGYPFIRIFGEIENRKLIDLGWHDHYIIEFPVNIDAYGKNVFHIFPWGSKSDGFWIKGNNIWCSTFQIEKTGELR